MILIFLLLLVLVVLGEERVQTSSYELKTFTAQEKQLDFNRFDSPYQINVKRLASTTPHEPNHCTGHPRSLSFQEDTEVFRLDTQISQRSYDESIYLSLTTLTDQEEIIEFQNLGTSFFAITNNNMVYFLKESPDGKLTKESSTQLPQQVRGAVAGKNFFVLIVDFAPLLLFSQMAILCSEGHCRPLEGWNPVQHITHANFMKVGSKRYVLLSQNEVGMSIYELTASNKLENYKTYDKEQFKLESISIFDIAPDTENNLIYALDYSSGLYALTFDPANPEVVKSFDKILDQKNCFSMDMKDSNYIVMNCKVGRSDFLLEVYKDKTTGHYIAQRPLFRYQTIFDVVLTHKFYAARGFSGLKFYWVNPHYPYPAQFKKAGQLFLHNAIQIRIKNKDGKDLLYYATPNSIRRVTIQEKASYATCISQVPTEEEYEIQYKAPCSQEPSTTCTAIQKIKYQVWKHRGISVMRTLVPTLLAFIVAVVIGFLLVLLYKKYKKEEDEVSLRFATSGSDFELYSAR